MTTSPDNLPLTFDLACSMLAKKSVNIRIHDEIARGRHNRAARFLFNRACVYLDDIANEGEDEVATMDRDIVTAGTRILQRGFGPMIARDLMNACLAEVMRLRMERNRT